MGKSIIMHIDEASWVWGQPRRVDGPLEETGSQFIGDLEKGPWIYINSVEPNSTVEPHSHTEDEVIYIVEGSLTIGDRTCGPGTGARYREGHRVLLHRWPRRGPVPEHPSRARHWEWRTS